MVLAPDLLSLAVKAALKIQKAVEQFKSNDAECARMYAFLGALGTELTRLQGPWEHSKVRPTIERLKDALEKTAAEAERCKSTRDLLRFLKADDIAAKLDQLRRDFSDEMLAAVVVATTNTYSEMQGMRQDFLETTISLHEALYSVVPVLSFQQQLERSTEILGSADDPANHVASTGLRKRYRWSHLKDAMSSSDRYYKHYKNNMPGGGSFSSVYKAQLDNQPVAIKNFVLDEGVRACFVRELQLVLKLQHLNVVKLLGYCFEYEESLVVDDNNGPVRCDKIGGLGLISSRYQQGLDEFINKTGDVVWPSVLKIIQGIAEGVRYLHRQPVVHLDLKPENILLDAEMTPKITNFGKARELEHGTNEITVENFHIGKYTAPELSKEDTAPSFGRRLMSKIIKPREQQLKASTKTDVWSFGVILLETIGLKCSAPSKDYDKRPIGPQDWVMRLQESELRDLFDRNRVTGEPQQRAARWCVTVGLMCCLPDPANRPSMGRVIDMLGWCMQEEITGIKKNQVTPEKGQGSSSSLIPEGYPTTFASDDKEKYKVLTEDMLRKLQDDAIKKVMKTLEIHKRGLAELLLRFFSWSPVVAINTWYDQAKDDFANVGMKLSVDVHERCNKCRGAGKMISAGCSHYYCKKCWGQKVHEALGGGRCQLSLECPSCKVAVTRELVEAVADPSDKNEYNRLVLRSYVDDSGGRIKWCPAACGRAVEFLRGSATADSKMFCGDCGWWR